MLNTRAPRSSCSNRCRTVPSASPTRPLGKAAAKKTAQKVIARPPRPSALAKSNPIPGRRPRTRLQGSSVAGTRGDCNHDRENKESNGLVDTHFCKPHVLVQHVESQ